MPPSAANPTHPDIHIAPSPPPQAWDVMAALGVPYQHVGAAQYARGLMRHVRHSEPQALADKLVVGAFIEARSCERFARVAPRLPPTLTKFYTRAGRCHGDEGEA